MSKNITIQEGGVGKQLTVDKLETALTGGGSCKWVPEDNVRLTTKSIAKNGTYKASSDGYYGYSQVTVSGVGTASGKGADGEQHMVTTDPETGELVDTVLADHIVIDTPPTFTGPYANNAYIGTEGMVVKAYKADGTLWTDEDHPDGVIPLSEITISPVVTTFDPSTAGKISVETDLPGVGEVATYLECSRFTYEAHDGYFCMGGHSGTQYDVRFISDTNTAYYVDTWTGGTPTNRYASYPRTVSSGGNTYTYYYASNNVLDGDGTPVLEFTTNEGNLALALFFGGGTMVPEGGQTVTVIWPRGDGADLMATFSITVENITPGGGA